jgi:hypothetical protein
MERLIDSGNRVEEEPDRTGTPAETRKTPKSVRRGWLPLGGNLELRPPRKSRASTAGVFGRLKAARWQQPRQPIAPRGVGRQRAPACQRAVHLHPGPTVAVLLRTDHLLPDALHHQISLASLMIAGTIEQGPPRCPCA